MVKGAILSSKLSIAGDARASALSNVRSTARSGASKSMQVYRSWVSKREERKAKKKRIDAPVIPMPPKLRGADANWD